MIYRTLRFPMEVEVINVRLLLVYYVMFVLTVVGLVGWLYAEQPWLHRHSMANNIHANMWMDPKIDATRFRHGDDEIFVATHLHDIAAPAGMSLQNAIVLNSTFLSVDAVHVSLFFHCNMPLSDWWTGRGITSPGVAATSSSTAFSSTDIVTKVLSSNGETVKVQKPGQALDFSLVELLELAGQPLQLDATNCMAGKNKMLAGAGHCPTWRLTGMELIVLVECFGETQTEGEAHHHICYLSVRTTARNEVSEERFVSMNGEGGSGTRLRLFHGVRLRVQGGGSMSSFTATELIAALSAVVVFLKLPLDLLTFFCRTMLGHLSRIYSQVMCKRFDFETAMGGMALRLMVVHNAFSHMRSQSCISETLLRKVLVEVFEEYSEELDWEEISRLAHFCFRAARKNTSREMSKQGTMARFEQEFSNGKESTGVDSIESEINSSCFSDICTSNEQVSFDAVIKLFDSDRKRTILERLFTPTNLARTLSTRRRHGLARVMDNVADVAKGLASGSLMSSSWLGASSRSPVESVDTLSMRQPSPTNDNDIGDVGVQLDDGFPDSIGEDSYAHQDSHGGEKDSEVDNRKEAGVGGLLLEPKLRSEADLSAPHETALLPPCSKWSMGVHLSECDLVLKEILEQKVTAIERRIERLEIKDMEGQISCWAKSRHNLSSSASKRKAVPASIQASEGIAPTNRTRKVPRGSVARCKDAISDGREKYKKERAIPEVLNR